MRAVIAASASLRASEWAFFYAVSAVDVGLSYNDQGAIKCMGRSMTPGELSCFASHFAMAKRFLEESERDFLIVSEDDIFIDESFDFDAVIRMMTAANIDYLRLFSREIIPVSSLVHWKRFQFFRFTWRAAGTQFYVLSKQGARNFVDYVVNLGGLTQRVDTEMNNYWYTGNTIYALYPWPVLERNIATTIQGIVNKGTEKLANAGPNSRPVVQRVATLLNSFKGRMERRPIERAIRKTDAQVASKVREFLISGKSNQFFIRDDL